jgi:membrane protein
MRKWLRTTFWRRLKKAVFKWSEDDASTLAASVGYYAIFSVFPMLLVLIAVFGFVLQFSGSAQSSQTRLLELLSQNTSPGLADQVKQVLSGIRTNAIINGPVGFVTLLVAAIGIFAQFEVAFDRIWNIRQPESKGIWRLIREVLFQRLRAFLMLVGVGLLVLVAFLADLALSAVGRVAPHVLGSGAVWRTIQVLVSGGLYWMAFTVVYRVLPKVPVRWSEAVQGALLAAVLWEMGRQALVAYLVGDRYGAYGVVGSLIVLMLWIYFAISIVFLGAEYVQVVWEENGGHSGHRAPPDNETKTRDKDRARRKAGARGKDSAGDRGKARDKDGNKPRDKGTAEAEESGPARGTS